MLASAMLALLVAMWGGLIRLGWRLPFHQLGLPVVHGPLIVCGFLGTLIGLERAVALAKSFGYVGPALSGLGALALIAGVPDPIGPLLIVLGSVGLVADVVAIIRRQPTLFTVTMGLGATAWFVGNCLWLARIPILEMFWWWDGFLILTIVGERLELSRLTGLGEQGRWLVLLGVGAFVSGAAVGLPEPALGLRLCGFAMLAMALWLLRYDLARRTARQRGLTRFIAVNLLAGYGWLGVGSLAWLWFGDDLTLFHYDLMLHSIFLGFVFSMIFAHAPIIFPAVLQRPLPYRPIFYLHSVLLQLSLLLRVGGDLAGSYPAYKWGGLLNAVALLLFVVSTASAVVSEVRKGARYGVAESGVAVN